jgi:hypothetical protein
LRAARIVMDALAAENYASFDLDKATIEMISAV